MRSLFFLLVVVCSTLVNVRGDDIRHDPGNDVENYWRIDTSGKSMEDDVQKFSK